jgi:hypothetical protein
VVFDKLGWLWVASIVTRNRDQPTGEVAVDKDCLAPLPHRPTVYGASRAARLLCAMHRG